MKEDEILEIASNLFPECERIYSLYKWKLTGEEPTAGELSMLRSKTIQAVKDLAEAHGDLDRISVSIIDDGGHSGVIDLRLSTFFKDDSSVELHFST